MTLKKEEVKHVAGLARIGASEEEISKFSHDLSSILDWIKQLEEVDISGIEPTAHIAGLENVAREDEAGEFGNKGGIIEMFPEEKDGYDKVKSIF